VVWAVVVIVVLGLGMPAVGWWLTRRPPPLATPDSRLGEIDRWLVDQFQLSWHDRSQVRAAVLTGRPVSDPALEAAARGFAAQVMADRFRALRGARRAGWINLILAAGYPCAVIVLLVVRHVHQGWPLVAIAVLNAGLASLAGWHNAVRSPKRIRRSAEQILRSTGKAAGPGQQA
jgi:hypothetical protein